MAIPSIAWISQTIASKLGISLGIELVTQLSSILFDEKDTDFASYDRYVRDEAAQKLREAKNELQKSLFIADQVNLSTKYKKEIFIMSRLIENAQEKIKYAVFLPFNKDIIYEDGIKYINLITLCECFAILEDTRKFTDSIDSLKKEVFYELLNNDKSRLRKIEKILDFRNMCFKTRDANLLKALSDTNPEIFENVRGLVTVLFKANEMKPPRFFKGKYHEKLQGPLLELVDDLALERGPIVSLSEIYVEFSKRHPNIQFSNEHLEKAVINLCDAGLLEGFEKAESGYKIVKLKPLKLTESYKNVIILASQNRNIVKNGVTKEELMQLLEMPSKLISMTLEELCKDNIAWYHDNRYYFPGLSETAYSMKKQIYYVS